MCKYMRSVYAAIISQHITVKDIDDIIVDYMDKPAPAISVNTTMNKCVSAFPGYIDWYTRNIEFAGSFYLIKNTSANFKYSTTIADYIKQTTDIANACCWCDEHKLESEKNIKYIIADNLTYMAFS